MYNLKKVIASICVIAMMLTTVAFAATFSDVAEDSAYYEAVETLNKLEIITGYEDGTFRGDNTLLKDQIIAVAARTLREKKKYYNPTEPAKYLAKFVDSAAIPQWATVDISLASRENLIIERTDGKFNGDQKMTRGEAALVLKKLFDRL